MIKALKTGLTFCAGAFALGLFAGLGWLLAQLCGGLAQMAMMYFYLMMQ